MTAPAEAIKCKIKARMDGRPGWSWGKQSEVHPTSVHPAAKVPVQAVVDLLLTRVCTQDSQ